MEEFIEKIYSVEIDQKLIASKTYKFLINEIIPRSRKCGFNNINHFLDSRLTAFLIRLEILNYLSRNETRKFLDNAVTMHKDEQNVTKINFN